MKKLFQFLVEKETTEKIKGSLVNEKGETVTTETDQKGKVNQKVFIRKPSRSLYDEAELYYGVRLSEGIKAGLLTRALLAKRFLNDGGILSEQEKDKYTNLISRLSEIQMELNQESRKDKKEQDSKKINELNEESEKIRADLVDLEMGQSALFDQTAENRARNKVILWWILNLSHFEDEEGKQVPVFSGESFEEKLNSYDEIDEKDERFFNEVVRKLMYYISFWYVGRAQSEEDFKKLDEADKSKDKS